MNKMTLLLVPAFLLSFSFAMASQDIAAGWGSPDIRYPREFDGNDVFKGTLSLKNTVSLVAWKGETVQAQAVVACMAGKTDSIAVRATSLSRTGGRGRTVIPASALRTGFVGYVMTDELNRDGSGGCGYRNSADFDSSYVADPIDHISAYRPLEEKSLQPVWLSIDVPRDIPAGVYAGNVEVYAGAERCVSLPLRLTVRDREMPQENIFHLDLWQNPYAVARYYGVEPFSREHLALMEPVMKLYADAGGKVITASIAHWPWNAQTFDPFESMVTWLRKADGTWWFDYTVFDIWIEFMMSLGVTGQINCYSMIPWKLSFQYLDQASNSFRYLSAAPGDPEYEQFWTVMLRSFASHLREKGWFDITMIAMDERPMDQMLAAVEVIKNADPDFRIAFAGNCHGQLLDVLDYYCIPIGSEYPEGTVEKRRSEGKVTTWYTCCTEAWPNTFTFSRPAEAEWIGWYVAANGLDGYLRWALNSWPEDPVHDSRFTAWAAGDTYLVYPDGMSSIRFERLKAGITAYRKIAALRDEFSFTGNKKGLASLDKALSLFVMPDKDRIREITSDHDYSGLSGEDPAADAIVSARRILDRL